MLRVTRQQRARQNLALMIDHNLIGRGYRYSDIRHVCRMLSPPSCDAFPDAYGSFNPHEALVDDCLTHFVNLISACASPQFPSWARESLRIADAGILLASARHVLADV